MNSDQKNNGNQQGSNDKIHASDLGETKDFNELSFDKAKNSYELDVKGKDTDYDHPLPYETTAANGGDDKSAYDEANPYIGDEYASKEEQKESDMEDLGIYVNKGSIVSLNPEDELLARTPEDDRDDLDEEGYPLNDSKPLK